MPTSLEKLQEMRRKAVFRVFENKFRFPIRITVGSATCENAAGAAEIYDRFQQHIEKNSGLEVILGKVGCAGRCDLEPMVTVVAHGQIPIKYMKVTPEKVDKIFEEHILHRKVVEEFTMRRSASLFNAQKVISICGGKNCFAKHSSDIEKAFLDNIQALGLQDKMIVTRSACQGLCEYGPVAYIYPDGVMYQKLTPEIVKEICEEHLLKNRSLGQYAWKGERLTNRSFPFFGDVYFFGKQLRLTLRNCGVIDPESIDEYLAVRGMRP